MNDQHEQDPIKDVVVAIQPFLVNEETAARLLDLSPRTVWQLRKDGLLPFVRHNTRIGYRPEALEAYAKSRETRDEKKTENPENPVD